MESSSLAVKYRPTTLQEFIGNEQVKSTVYGFIKQERFPNSILIHGSTGLGKTTLARIIARTLSCKTNDICNKCPSCMNPLDNHSDIKEVDVGGDRGIDSIRALKDYANFSPLLGNMRVIIMDEVHALTSQGASALLKVLEEPPKSTMFLLCTTDLQKMLTTIRGRTKQLELSAPTFSELTTYLLAICKHEKVQLDKSYKPIFQKIYDISGGSVRGAVQLLETVIASYNSGSCNPDSMLEALIGDNRESQDIDEAILGILSCIASKDQQGVVKSVNKLDPRKLFSTLKFTVDQLIDHGAGIKIWSPLAFRAVKQKSMDFRLLVKLGLELNKLELQLNQGLSETSIKYMLAILAGI